MPAEPVGVDPAGQQLGVLRLAGEHVHDVQPGRVAVLEVGQLLGEHHRSRVPVAVHQGERAVRLGGQRGGDQRQHRRDAGAGRDRGVVAHRVRRERGGEVAERRQHVDRRRRLAACRWRTRRTRRRRPLARRSAAGRSRRSSAGVEQIEYERRTSSPVSMRRRTVRCWPAVNANSSRSSAGTAKVTATASSVSGPPPRPAARGTAAGAGTGRVIVTVTAASRGRTARAQARQRHSALHAVEPNRDSSSVSGEPQRGQRPDSRHASGTGPARPGGRWGDRRPRPAWPGRLR